MAGSTALKNRGGFGGRSQSIILLVFVSSDTSCIKFTDFETELSFSDLSPQFPYSGQLTKPGQHDRTPVTTKHEKEALRQPMFAGSYRSFQGRPFHSKPPAQGQ